MKTKPVTPAQIVWGDDGLPRSAAYGDLYHPQAGAATQARHVFLGGNGLPARWAEAADFTIVETGFGLGNNFLATWDAWRRDPRRCRRLHYVAVEAHPAATSDLQRAHEASPWPALARALVQRWPPATPGLHALDFDGGGVRLLLGFGPAADLLPALSCQAQAFYLDGFAPRHNPQMWQPALLQALARRAAPGATAATWCVAGEVRRGLAAAGFEVERSPGIGGKRSMTQARFAPRFVPRPPPAAACQLTPVAKVVVVGAGLAGACTAAALAALGVAVEVLDGAATPASGASGNPAGLFHATVHADDGLYSRLLRAGALTTFRLVAELASEGGLPCGLDGMLRLHRDGGLDRMQALIAAQGLPPDFVQALDAAAASERAGVTLADPAWWHHAAGWVAPPALVHRLLAHPAIKVRAATPVARLEALPAGAGWACRDVAGRLVAEAPLVVLAAAEGNLPLLRPLGLAVWRERSVIGQLTVLDLRSPLRLPLAGDGYAITLPDGGLLCGASRREGDDLELHEQEHRGNAERLLRLTGLRAPADTGRWFGRAGRRQLSADRLPVAGALPLPPAELPPRRDQARWLPRLPGLYVLGALGGRGLTLAPLLGRLLAAQITGTPQPLERDLVDAVDPARWIVRAARRGTSL